ncbi:CD209 antigen [Elysia marginata]|uniref:CD209 antigen n=1 Tax=Elysia marginata TaxID=1093978 RepID=A0AAV4I802_9GAST|nr:CD209 antigen [Elysia marginata]
MIYVNQVYLNNSLPIFPHQLYKLDPDAEPVCLRDITAKANFDIARSTCVSYGGFLISIKTVEKLELFKSITSGQDRWVGLDDIDVEGQFVWHGDGSNLTAVQEKAVFSSGEPNNLGEEDCVQFRAHVQKLNDLPCHHKFGFVCERSLPGSTC